MINFSDTDEHQDVVFPKYSQKLISNETEYGSIKDPLRMHRNERNLVSKFSCNN